MKETYSPPRRGLPDHKASPEKSANNSTPENSNNGNSTGDSFAAARTLWDISTPEEVAYSIIGIYPDPLRELIRREHFSRRQKNPVNLRFWAEVRRVIETALDG